MDKNNKNNQSEKQNNKKVRSYARRKPTQDIRIQTSENGLLTFVEFAFRWTFPTKYFEKVVDNARLRTAEAVAGQGDAS
jgi:hypothetical protein